MWTSVRNFVMSFLLIQYQVFKFRCFIKKTDTAHIVLYHFEFWKLVLPNYFNVQMVPTYDGSTFWQCKSDTHSLETVLQILNFDCFPGLVICGKVCSHDVGQQHGAATPVSHAITRVNKQCTYNHSISMQPFCFSFSVQYSINYMR